MRSSCFFSTKLSLVYKAVSWIFYPVKNLSKVYTFIYVAL